MHQERVTTIGDLSLFTELTRSNWCPCDPLGWLEGRTQLSNTSNELPYCAVVCHRSPTRCRHPLLGGMLNHEKTSTVRYLDRSNLIQILGDQWRRRSRLPLPPPLGFVFWPRDLRVHDGVRLGSLCQYFQSGFGYRGLHLNAAGQSQRVSEWKLHRHRPGYTEALRPSGHHSHENRTDAAFFKHTR